MPEVNSTQAAAIAAGSKILARDAGKPRVLFAQYVQGAGTQAINDTILLGRIPAGCRIGLGGRLSCSAGTASSTMSVGLRSRATGTVVSATAIASAVNTQAAGVKALENGASIAAGLPYITTEEVEVYATITGAVLAAAQALTFEIPYAAD